MADTLHYKIRHRKTGLFKTGGGYTHWSKNGKTWTSLGAFMSHFSLYKSTEIVNGEPREVYKIGDDWEVITIVVPPPENPVNVVDWLEQRKTPKNALVAVDPKENE